MVALTFKEASTINLVVADLLHTHSILNRQSTISPSDINHLGLRDTMADDLSRRFEIVTHFFPSLPVNTNHSLQVLGHFATHPNK